MKGVILGTTGLGKGLDDPELLPVFKALQDEKLPIFLHPHYGLPSSVVSSVLSVRFVQRMGKPMLMCCKSGEKDQMTTVTSFRSPWDFHSRPQ